MYTRCMTQRDESISALASAMVSLVRSLERNKTGREKMFAVFLVLGVGCRTGKLDFGEDKPTDLSGSVDPVERHPSCAEDEGIVLETPSTGDYAEFLDWDFTRYAAVVAPNGGVIPIFAQDGVSDAQLYRARSLLRFFLTDAPGTVWGSDKTAVANKMADNGAVLMMPNGAHEEGSEPRLDAQPLYSAETPVEGGDWFMENDYGHRDAGFEEIFHLVHDAGIGTYMPGALPEYQADLDTEARAAITDGRWGIPVDPGVSDWLEELDREDSLAQEYIASVIDSYYGLWGPWDEDDGGMWGIYIAKTRAEIEELDPKGMELLEQFLPPYIGTEFRLDPKLDQDFTLSFDAAAPYTYKSQYFLNVTLTGTNAVSLEGNAQDNSLRGNEADNGIDGGAGDDTAIYCSAAAEYSLSWEGDLLLVSGPEGSDRLADIEWLHFSDGRVAVSDIE
jgi:hypothetical protein